MPRTWLWAISGITFAVAALIALADLVWKLTGG